MGFSEKEKKYIKQLEEAKDAPPASIKVVTPPRVDIKEARLTIRFDINDVDVIDRFCEHTGMHRSDVVRWAVKEWIDRHADEFANPNEGMRQGA